MRRARLFAAALVILLAGIASAQVSITPASVSRAMAGTWTALQSFSSGIDVVSGHIFASGTAPALSACGTTPSAVVGSDTAFRFTTGSGVLASCTATFAAPFAVAPMCVAVDNTLTQALQADTTTTTVIVTGSDITSDEIAVICLGGS